MTAAHGGAITSALSDRTNQERTVKQTASSLRLKPKAAAVEEGKPRGKAKGSTGARGLQTAVRQSGRPSR